MSLTDRIARGLEAGWKVTDGATLTQNQTHEADVVIIGTGAGGGTTAEILAKAGLSVILVEEGRLYHQKDFKMNELDAYASLYQEGMSRVTILLQTLQHCHQKSTLVKIDPQEQ